MEFQNPILSGFHPDPSLCRVGEDYYLVTSSFEYFPGVPIFHSRDLIHWQQIGHALTRPSQMPGPCPSPSGGIFAPTLRYHEGTFYLITTNVSHGGNFVITATDPAGPWSDPVWLRDAEGIDPSLFFDDDGRCWYVGNGNPAVSLYEGHHTIWLQEFDIPTLQLCGPKRVIVDGGSDITKEPIWIEGPHLYKIGGWYYLLASEGGTGENHSVVVFRSHTVTGPYESYAGNPILTNRHLCAGRPHAITCTGHADLVQTQHGEWWMVLLACRPYPPSEENHYNTGRETFLVPMAWRDEWPVTADGSGTLLGHYVRPALPPHPWADSYGTGAFHWRDDFNGEQLRQEWNTIGPTKDEWYSLTARAGTLRLLGRPHDLTSKEQPSFLGIRQRHQTFSVETTMDFRPGAEGDQAGLVVMQNRRSYYALVCVRVGRETCLQLRKHTPEKGASSTVVAEVVLPERRVALRIDGHGKDYAFLYATRNQPWRPLGEKQDGTILSTRRAGGFVGAYVGLLAQSSAPDSMGGADFTRFTYSGKES